MSKVVKFGGSSLASAEQFKKVGNIIRADKERKYAVSYTHLENIKTAIVCILIAAAVVTVAKLLGAKRFQGICMAVSAGLSGILMITLVTVSYTHLLSRRVVLTAF